MEIADFLSRFDGLKATGADRWAARCPAHPDHSPSLAIRVTPDGRILCHCFAGCDTESVLGAIGVSLTDLFPKPLTQEFLPKIRAPFSALEALTCLAEDSTVVAFCIEAMASGQALSERDAAAFWASTGRINSALEAVHGS